MAKKIKYKKNLKVNKMIYLKAYQNKKKKTVFHKNLIKNDKAISKNHNNQIYHHISQKNFYKNRKNSIIILRNNSSCIISILAF